MKKVTKSRRVVNIIMLLIFVTGVSVALFPFMSSAVRHYQDQRVVARYQQKANKQNKKTAEKILTEQKAKNAELAKEKNNPGLDSYNANLETSKVKRPQSYYDKHMLGSLTIPKIKVDLPVFDETNDILLNKGATLLQGTSYPTGGKNTHAVISAHRGLPHADMFDELPKSKVGDQFFLKIGKQKLAYQIESTKIIEPTDTSDLIIQPSRDLVTLMACTPYMINSHRLIYTGKRIPYPKKADNEIKETIKRNQWLVVAWILGTLILLIIGILVYRFRKKK